MTMKKLIINEAHKEDINKALAEAQGKAKARTIDGYEALVKEIEYAKKRFENLPAGIPKKAYDGCILIIRVGAGHFPNAYKYVPVGTYLKIRFRKDGSGEILDIDRVNVEGGKEYRWGITEAMRDYVVASLAGYMLED
jgi:hypothetical protein